MVTRSQRRLRRTIKILENSVELSAKETDAKILEKSYKNKIRKDYGIEDYPVQSLTDFSDLKKTKKRKQQR
ncbi:MAG: hypothetical protein NWF10_00700 [Candidatus Bathyarchaeota archaeon]|jgi:hypothetical protein|nr:hypothetical protein [Candidatus Bathyarchaeota archaeon]